MVSIIDSRTIDGFICGVCMSLKDRDVGGLEWGIVYRLSGSGSITLPSGDRIARSSEGSTYMTLVSVMLLMCRQDPLVAVTNEGMR